MKTPVDVNQGSLMLPPHYPDAYLPLHFCIALVAGALLVAPPRPAPTAALLLLVAAVPAAASIVLSQLHGHAARFCLPLAALAVGLATGSLATGTPAQQPVEAGLLNRAYAVEGYLSEDASRYADSDTRYRLRLTRVVGHAVEYEADGTVMVVVPGGAEYSAGRRLRVFYGHDDLRIAGSTILIRSRAVDELGWHAAHFGRRDRLRQRLFGRIDAMGYRPGGLFRALLTGSRSRLTLEQQRLFRQSGSSHLLALSGMHLGIVAAVSFGLVRLVLGRRAAFMFTLAACVAYIYLVGSRPSLQRAMAMLALGGCVRLCGRRTEVINTFALAISVLVLLMPSLLHQLSFQLSSLSILGIVGPGARLRRVLAPYLPRGAATGLAAAAGAQLATAPLALYVFGTVYPVALLSSVVLIPLVSLFVWSGLLWLGLASIWPQLPSALLLLSDQARWIQTGAWLFAHAPTAAPSALTTAVTLAVVASIVAALYRRDVLIMLRRPMGAWPL